MRTGGVAYEMLRPVDLYWFWFSRAIANRTAPAALRCVPMFAVAFLFLGLRLPDSPAAAFGAGVVGAVLLSSAIACLMSITLMWTISGEGTAQLLSAAVTFFSGMGFPLPFFPDWLRPAVDAMPFRGIMDTPFRLYLGHIPPSEAWGPLLHQWVWIALLILLGRMLVRRGLRRLVVQGG